MFGIFKFRKKPKKSGYYIGISPIHSILGSVNGDIDEDEKNYLVNIGVKLIPDFDDEKNHYIMNFENGDQYVLQYNAHKFHIDPNMLSQLRYECAAKVNHETGQLEQLDEHVDGILISSLSDIFYRAMKEA